MQVTETLKKNVQAAIKGNLSLKKGIDLSYTNNRHAYWLDIHPSIYSRVLKGEIIKVLSDGEWVRLAVKLHVDMDGLHWKTAETKTYRYIKAQILACMEYSAGGIFCDDSSIGKTWVAEEIDINHPNVALVDCSQTKTWGPLLRQLCRAFGFNPEGRLRDVRKMLIENIYTLQNAIIILDEVGDLSDAVILELKGLWNALPNMLGWYIMGANGLRKKLKKKLDWQKVGYEEWFNRLGNRIHSVIGRTAPGEVSMGGLSQGEIEIMKRKQIEDILKVNYKTDKETLFEMVNNCDLNPRRMRIEILKRKTPPRPSPKGKATEAA